MTAKKIQRSEIREKEKRDKRGKKKQKSEIEKNEAGVRVSRPFSEKREIDKA